MTRHIPAQTLIALARRDCEAVAQGPFTPIVFVRREFIGGEREIGIGFLSSTTDGRSCIVWL